MLYSRKSPRLAGYDYRQSGAYFITICTKDREHYFGEIVDWEMICNDLWKYTYDCWSKIKEYFPFVNLRDFICMPNHIHGVLLIDNIEFEPSERYISKFEYQKWSLGHIVRGFKIWITKYANSNNMPFARQWRYYDHIIRDDEAYQNISNYIKNNPKNRKDDWFWS